MWMLETRSLTAFTSEAIHFEGAKASGSEECLQWTDSSISCCQSWAVRTKKTSTAATIATAAAVAVAVAVVIVVAVTTAAASFEDC